MSDQILIRAARLHNLKDIDLAIPKNQLVVLSGPSGSGKSSLALDILYRESQRQYMEALGLLPYGMGRAAVEQICGLIPSVGIDQRLANRSPRSTVGTISEIYTYLRVLYARLGERPCPHCGLNLPALSAQFGEQIELRISSDASAEEPESFFSCPTCGKEVPVLEMGHFSFNKPAGACPTCTGLGVLKQVDLARLVDEQKSLLNGAVSGWEPQYAAYYAQILQAAGRHYGLQVDPARPIREYSSELRDLLLFGVEDPAFRRHFPAIEPPKTVRQGRFEGVRPNFERRYAGSVAEPQKSAKLEEFMVTTTCPDCQGTRLRPESRVVTVRGVPISDLSRLAVINLGSWLESLPKTFSGDENLAAGAILSEISTRIQRLADVGAGYLSLERSAPSLSQGEAQRLRLAALLGSSLSGLLYIFDEPTIGLHPRDTRRLISILCSLRDLGNTVLVIEHDLEVIAAGDYLIDFGPGGGRHGGRVVAAGPPDQVAACTGSPTGDYLSGRLSIPAPPQRRSPGAQALTICGARHHNLKDLTLKIPLGLFVAVTGVSGSGKSSLIFDVLERSLRQRLQNSKEAPGEHQGITGSEHLDRVIASDQGSIGRMPRSNVATFADIFTPIRDAFAAAPAAR